MRNPALELEESRIRWAAVVNTWKKESELAISNSKQLRASYSHEGIGEERSVALSHTCVVVVVLLG